MSYCETLITLIEAAEFRKNPAEYLVNVDDKPIRIIFPDSKLTISVMGLGN